MRAALSTGECHVYAHNFNAQKSSNCQLPNTREENATEDEAEMQTDRRGEESRGGEER